MDITSPKWKNDVREAIAYIDYLRIFAAKAFDAGNFPAAEIARAEAMLMCDDICKTVTGKSFTMALDEYCKGDLLMPLDLEKIFEL